MVSSIAVSGNTIFAGLWSGGVIRSANNGTSWTAVNSGLTIQGFTPSVEALAANGGSIFAGTWGNGVFLSTNDGANWTAVNSGLTNTDIQSLAVSGGTLFAGTFFDGVWSRQISEMGVLHPEPQGVTLDQSNFKVLSPNLTNSNAKIEFSLPHSDMVSVIVYNLLGHEIASLVNKNLSRGSHCIPWNTRNLAAGCYTVRLQAGSNSYVKSIPIFR
jgi:hypothetical protein